MVFCCGILTSAFILYRECLLEPVGEAHNVNIWRPPRVPVLFLHFSRISISHIRCFCYLERKVPSTDKFLHLSDDVGIFTCIDLWLYDHYFLPRSPFSDCLYRSVKLKIIVEKPWKNFVEIRGHFKLISERFWRILRKFECWTSYFKNVKGGIDRFRGMDSPEKSTGSRGG